MRTINDIITGSTVSFFAQKDFEDLYIASRKKENRIYTDEQVERLPFIESSHVHFNEWQIRKRSAARLINYLENKDKPLSMLEAGCGNGWLSAWLGSINHSSIMGTDVNRKELEQARRVFGKKTNITFSEAGIGNIQFEEKFDVIIFAASIQYFSSFENITRNALSLLNKDGEIHILDSYFYKPGEIELAKQRSLSYYRSLGFEEMAQFYFHHSVESLDHFDHKLLFEPAAIKNKLFGKRDPFPWVRIMAE